MVIFPVIQGQGFSALQKIALVVRDLAFVIGLIRVMDQSPLREFKVNTFGHHPPSAIWKELFNALEGHCAAHLLTSLTAAEGVDPSEPNLESEVIISLDTIGALFAFPNLTEVDLPFHHFTLDDSDVAEIAKAWPHIEILTLHSRVPPAFPPRVTLSGLLPFVEHCPNLASLAIIFDATVVCPFNSKNRIWPDTMAPFTLDVGNSPLQHPTDVATFLSECFPTFSEIEYVVSHDVVAEHWHEVGQIIYRNWSE